MKIIANKFFVIMIYLLGVSNAFAAPHPPAPTGRRPPPPPGLPIDENILFLLLIAVVLGIYIINNHNVKTKTPI